MKQLFFAGFIIAAFFQTALSQDTWQNYYRSKDLEINYKRTECHDPANGIHKKIVVFQFVNLTGKMLSVAFERQMWYNGKCTGCDHSPEHQSGIRLAPHQTAEGSCENKTKSLYIIDQMKGGSSTLTKFELANIKILIAQ